MASHQFPKRIVCLSAESADVLCRIGAGNQLVGVTAYARLPKSLRTVPRISGFSAASVRRIVALKPALVVGYSDVQADIAAALIKEGINVLITNQRTLSEIENVMLMWGSVVGKMSEARALVRSFRSKLKGRSVRRRLRVYFEEWPEPMVSGVGWVGELIELAGGEDIFPELRGGGRAEHRVVTSEEIVCRNPDVILASWCGRKVRMSEFGSRPGWQSITAIQRGHVYEIDSNLILQPGPVVAEGYKEICGILRRCSLPSE